ncbi:MAG: hypothetical protein MUE30_12625 [Spirosomaceae bacterium]|nr:hypothetical protein [Spirosomataceae bacterium]
MRLTKAESIDNVYRAFLNTPLDQDDIDFFTETQKARGGQPFRRRMLHRLATMNDVAHKYIMVGYRGCGKSTELNQLKEDLEKQTEVGSRYFVVSYSIKDELSLVNLNYMQLLIVTMEKLFGAIDEHQLGINQEYLDLIKRWVQTKEITKISDTHKLYEKRGELKYDASFFKSFFGSFKIASTHSASMKETMKEVIEPRLSELIDLCNRLITEVRLGLHKIDKDDLLIIVEDLDKLLYDKAKEVFLDHVDILTALYANFIFTFPISLYYSAWWVSRIKNYFGNAFEFPMIKVREKDGSPSTDGLACLRELIEKRMSLSLFESSQLLDDMILMSGGNLADLFRLIRDAADFAIDDSRSVITAHDYQRALAYLINDYQNTISDVEIEGKLYTTDQMYEALVQLATNKTYENSVVMLHLRQTLLVLGYNSDFWCDVHPIVKEILKRKGKIE